jgi:hypothetical protein
MQLSSTSLPVLVYGSIVIRSLKTAGPVFNTSVTTPYPEVKWRNRSQVHVRMAMIPELRGASAKRMSFNAKHTTIWGKGKEERK